MTAAESPAKAPSRARLRFADLIVPAGSISLLVAMLALVLASAGNTLGYDYSCYAGAAHHLLDVVDAHDDRVRARRQRRARGHGLVGVERRAGHGLAQVGRQGELDRAGAPQPEHHARYVGATPSFTWVKSMLPG